MFELLADPAAIALLGTFGGGILLKGGETLLKKRSARPAPVMSYKESSAAKLDKVKKTEFDCAVWDQRHFEKKLVAAGIQANVEAMCEDKECPECYPNRPGNGRKEAPEIGTVRHPNDTQRWRLPKPPADPEKIRRMKAEAKAAFDKSKAGKQRVAEVSGRVVPIPHNVPKFATGALYYDSGRLDPFIGWKWHDFDEKHRPVRSYRQNISKEMFDSFPLAGKREPFTTKGGSQMVVCRKCDDTYYLRPGMTPVTSFTCKRCIEPPRPPKGPGGGSPVRNLHDTLRAEHEKYKQEIKAEQYKIDEFKKEIQYLNEQMCKMEKLNYNRIGTEKYYK